MQSRIFRLLGISDEEANKRFGFFLSPFRYGAPPHGGFAFGIDRLVAILAGEENIREVIAFPKTQSGIGPHDQRPDSRRRQAVARPRNPSPPPKVLATFGPSVSTLAEPVPDTVPANPDLPPTTPTCVCNLRPRMRASGSKRCRKGDDRWIDFAGPNATTV